MNCLQLKRYAQNRPPNSNFIIILFQSIATLNGTKKSCSFYGVPTGFHNLPTDVLIRIFKYFEEKELLKCIMPVCRKWQHAALSPVLWKKFHASGTAPTYYICQKLRTFSNLISIRLSNVAEPIAIIRQISRYQPNLKHFALRNSGVITETSLRNFIQCCKRLESLDLNGTKFKGNRFYEEIAGLMYLKSVNFSKNNYLSVHNLLSLVLNSRKLEELKISSFSPTKDEKQLSDEDVLFIINNLAAQLKSLTLDTTTLTNFSFMAIMRCSNLEKLGLYRARNLSPDVIVNISKHLHYLNTLKVRDAHLITGPNIAELFGNGKDAMKDIISIDFTGCSKINDVGIKAIATCCSQLQLLRLKGCKSVKSLRPVRDHCTQLKMLNVAFCINLDPLSLLPLPKQMGIIIIDKNSRFNPIVQHANKESHVSVKICLSEYNKLMEEYKHNYTK
ncbi:hypothetical protein FQA39_LY10990 [Lamprigera yunnana]|nr:hypothetical protein FQA39_LY10990 [Lamprigera yunnana]